MFTDGGGGGGGGVTIAGACGCGVVGGGVTIAGACGCGVVGGGVIGDRQDCPDIAPTDDALTEMVTLLTPRRVASSVAVLATSAAC